MGREQSDFSIKFVPVFNRADSGVDSFLEEDASFVALNALTWNADDEDEDEDEEETERAVFTSIGLPTWLLPFSWNNFFEWLASSVFTFDSAITVEANDSATFLPRTVFPNSLNGIPNSRVAHTSQLGLHDEPRGSWQTLLFLASSMECHR